MKPTLRKISKQPVRVGFIGLGAMGKPMAMNILKAGFDLMVTDVREDPIRELVRLGAKSAHTAKDVAAATDIVLASLPSVEISQEVAFSSNGVLAGAKEGTLYIETSTIMPSVIKEIAKQAVDIGVQVLDAPVSGGAIAQRLEGRLTIMVGGAKDAVEKVTPVLKTIGSKIFHVGDVGAGNMVKIVNNLIAVTNIVNIMEGMAFGTKAGIDPQILRDVIAVSTGGGPGVFENVVTQILNRNFEPPPGKTASAALRIAYKDLKLALDLANELSVPLTLGSTALQSWAEGKARGLGNSELWGLIKVFEEKAGIKVAPFK
jgi:2-hydroxymethylglutarate dehydrogenase